MLEATPSDVMDAAVPLIILNSDENTVSHVRRLVDDLYASGSAGGFPLVTKEADGLYRVYGYVGVNELDHALSNRPESSDDDDDPCVFIPPPSSTTMTGPGRGLGNLDADALDLSHLVDHAPVTVSARSPMVYVHELFVKLGIRYLVVQDELGIYRGVIEKNRCATLPPAPPALLGDADRMRGGQVVEVPLVDRGAPEAPSPGDAPFARSRVKRHPSPFATSVCADQVVVVIATALVLQRARKTRACKWVGPGGVRLSQERALRAARCPTRWRAWGPA